jgi:hypothetical protein
MDLSDPEAAISELEKYPKPDVIFASPPCETWVSVSRGNLRHFTNKKGHNLYWENKWNLFNFPSLKETSENGIKTAETTAEIIKYFKPKFWVIENGNSSWLFDYLFKFCSLSGFLNKCYYCNYSKFKSLKPTIMKSNRPLILNNVKPHKSVKMVRIVDRDSKKKNSKATEFITDKKLRSKVPAALYRDIMRQFERGGQPALFPLEEVS